MTVDYGTRIGFLRRPPDYSATGVEFVWAHAPELDLSVEGCREVGSEPCRVGSAWACELSTWRVDKDGVESDLQLGVSRGSAATVRLLLRSWITDELESAIVVTPLFSGGSWTNDATLTVPADLTPGRYRLALTILWPDGTTWTHCGGVLDVLPALPEV